MKCTFSGQSISLENSCPAGQVCPCSSCGGADPSPPPALPPPGLPLLRPCHSLEGTATAQPLTIPSEVLFPVLLGAFHGL